MIPTHSENLQGKAVLRLLELSDLLTPGELLACLRTFWDGFVNDFFTKDSKFLFGVYNSKTKEQNQFEICNSLVARFFHTQYECQVTSIQLTMDQTIEYIVPRGMCLECPISSFIYRYSNGTMVILSGRTSVILEKDINHNQWKIQQWTFSCDNVEELVSRASLIDLPPPSTPTLGKKKITKQQQQQQAQLQQQSIIGKQVPPSLVNDWGLPDRVYALLYMCHIMSNHSEDAFLSLFSNIPSHPFNISSTSPSSASINKQEDINQPSPSTQANNIKMESTQSPTVKNNTSNIKSESDSSPTANTKKKPKQTKRKKSVAANKDQNNNTSPQQQQDIPTTNSPMITNNTITVTTPTMNNNNNNINNYNNINNNMNMNNNSINNNNNNNNSDNNNNNNRHQQEVLLLQQQQNLLLQHQHQQQQRIFQIRQQQLQMQQMPPPPHSPYPQTNPSYPLATTMSPQMAMLTTSSPVYTNTDVSYLSTPTTPGQLGKRKTMVKDESN
ncbi:unnamed protein product [Cunninghamella echinulata]